MSITKLVLLLTALSCLLQAQTAVTLTTSPNPSQLGAPVILTATVTPSTSAGKVTFYDGVTVLGIKPLASGAASLSTIALPAGNRKLRAYYAGVTSNVVTQAVKASGSAGFTARPPVTLPGSFTVPLAADFNGDGHSDIAVFDNSTGQLDILLGDGAGNFQLAHSTPLPGNPFTGARSMAAGDFNGDGKLDLAIVETAQQVSILLGNGDGSFQPQLNYPITSGGIVVVADFNGDGKADLAVSNNTTGVDTLLGNGDGTFQAAVSHSISPLNTSISGVALAVADINGDGKPDLVTVNDFTVNILLGNGDGSFHPAAAVAGLNEFFTEVLVDDFNGDGKPDLATNETLQGGSATAILLGKGDGTFQAPVRYQAGSINGLLTAVSDLDGDGNSDLIFVSPCCVNASPLVLLGKGDGSFQPLASSPFGAFAHTLIAAEWNGDGRTDFAYFDSNGALNIALGSTLSIAATGGTLQSAAVSSTFATPLRVLVQDGNTPVAGVTVTFTAPAAGPSAVLSSNTAITGANGVASVTATANSQAGAYMVTATALSLTAPAVFSLTNLTGFPLRIQVNLTQPQAAVVGTAFPKPLSVTFIDNNGLTVPGLSVAFTAPSSGASAVLSAGTAVTDANGAATVTATANNIAGHYVVTAAYGGLTGTFNLTNLQPQAVTLTSSANPSRFGAPISLTATLSNPGSATGVIAFLDGATLLGSRTVTAGTASISGVLLPAGIRKLRAFYSGDTNYVSATSNVSGQTVNAVAGGTLVSQNLVSLPVAPSSVALGDFNGDAKADFAFANSIPDTNPWWQVDLGATIGIDSVAIWNRTDCCGSRLSDYWLFISNTPFQATDTPATLQGRAGVFASHQTVAPNPSATIPAFTQGRYVRVQLSGANYLSLAEVQVFSLSSNVALHKAATQSSTYQGLASAAASAAVDGNTDGNFSDGSISSTDIAISGVMVALGQGDGTFQPPVTYPTGMTTETSIAVGDFNGDGSADLAVSGTVGAVDTPLPVVSILLGNSDGTFRPAVKYPAGTLNPVLTGSFPAPAGTTGPLVVGDFNGDGRADLFVIDNISQFFGCGGDQPIPCGVNHFTVSYLLTGNGDGSFNLAVFSGAPAGPYAIADFDGDGKPDIATSLGVTLGSGRFAPFSQALAIAPSAFAADLNGDGKPDLVTGNVILLGNGDGSFRPPATYAFAAAVNSGDFNGDGIADLVVVDSVGNLAGIWYGNGDGSFRQGLTINGGAPLAVADFSGDGRADILTASSGGARVVLGAVTGAFTLTATGGTPQSAVVGTPFAAPLQVTVLNNGSPASGITVVFSAPTVGPSATLSASQAVTNALGVATVTATANNIPGTYVVTATVGAVSTTFSLTNLPGQNSNLAQGKTATQSSTLGYPTAIAASAVDGNTNGGFFAGSVTATNLDPNAWWQVDLGASVTVGAIVIWNRTDCCGARLNDYWVFVSNTPFLATDTPATLQNRAGTFANHQTSAPNPSFIVMPIVQGRYVRVQLSGTDYLSLAEVQVFGNAAPLVTNVAQGKPAVQSSTLAGAPTAIASSAVDGNSDGSFFNGSVTATNLDSNAWWQVDLGGSASISSIVIFNRTDCCSSRLSDFWVFVSDTPFLASDTPATLQNRVGTFVSHQTSAPNPSTTITLNTQGRYVRVQLSGADYLSLAEVQVFGTGAPAISNVAQGKSAAQSSTLPGIPSAAAGSAVDGNTDGNFYDGSVTATNLDPNPWWQVDLGVSRAISSIVIYNRTDCCGSRLSDYWVFVSDTPFLATDTPATLQYRPGTFANYQTTAPNPSTSIANAVQGRYVRVQLSSADYLSLAEVQVFGQ